MTTENVDPDVVQYGGGIGMKPAISKTASLILNELLTGRKYDYMDAVIPHFWGRVFDDTREGRNGWKGMVVAHGDKCDQYFDTWEEVGIPRNRAALMYLLTFTSKLDDTPKYQSLQWVIDNYPEYSHRLRLAEIDVAKQIETFLTIKPLPIHGIIREYLNGIDQS